MPSFSHHKVPPAATRFRPLPRSLDLVARHNTIASSMGPFEGSGTEGFPKCTEEASSFLLIFVLIQRDFPGLESVPEVIDEPQRVPFSSGQVCRIMGAWGELRPSVRAASEFCQKTKKKNPKPKNREAKRSAAETSRLLAGLEQG